MYAPWTRRCSTVFVLGVVAALLNTGPRAIAQAVFGQIVGTVTDSTGAVIPNATITVTDVAKGTSVTLHSNGAGEFTVEHLIPDTYSVKIAAPGFKGFEQTGIEVLADSSPSMTVVMSTGASDQTVEVRADQVPQLKTDRADVATTFNSQELEELPIPDHNFTNLQLLLPGAVQLGWAHAASENPQGSKQIQIDGQAFGGVNYTLDGTDNQDAILGIIVINPNSESMSEAKLATQNFDAEFGKAVASVETVQTKSGTNQFHGTGFENYESNSLLAKDPFTLGPSDSYLPGTRHQFGGSLGGPIMKDRIFFFGDYQGVRQSVGSVGTGTVPTLLALQSCTGSSNASSGQPGCDFSDYLNTSQQYAGSAGSPTHRIFNNTGQTVNGVANGSPWPNNIIPLSLVSPQAQNLFNLLLKNDKPTSTALYNNYSGSGSGIFNSDQWDVRGDATLNDRIHAFGRFSRFTDTLSGASLFGPAGGPGLGIAGYGGVSTGANDSFALGTDIAINSKLITDVRLGYFRYNILTHKNDPGNTNLPFLGENIASGSLNPTDYGTPDIQIADVSETDLNQGVATTQNSGPQFGSGLNEGHCNCPLKEKEDQFQIVNNWTKTIGNHEVKFGVDLRYARNLRVPSDADRTGNNNFGNGPTSNGSSGSGLGFATFILGDVTSFNRYTSAFAGETNAKEFQPRDFFYVQDTWRATRKLTANIGVRYEYYAPERVNGKDNGALLNLQTGYINVAGEGGVPLNMGVSAPKNPWNPRLGVAYQINEKTVIRGGYGRSFDLGVFGSTFGHVVTQNLPVLANQSLNGTGGNTSYAFNLSNPSVSGNGATSPLTAFTSPAISSAGQIAINSPLPGAGGATIGQSVSVKARPFTERLPTLDAWNVAVQRSLTPLISAEVSYVGNKGTHTLSDGDGNNTNPNEAAIFLPASYSSIASNGTPIALHYDNNPGDQTYTDSNSVVHIGAIPAFCTANPSQCSQGVPLSGTYAGATNNNTLLQRYVGGSLPACNGPCNWTQSISYYGDDQDTHYNALQVKITRGLNKGYSVNLNYAYQVGRDNASGFSTWNKQAVIGNDQAIRRSAFTGYGVYRLPFGRKGQYMKDVNFLTDALIGGWEISPTLVWQSGLPFSYSYSECGNTISSAAPCQPSGNDSSLKYVKSGYAHKNGNVQWFTPVGGSICNTPTTAAVSSSFTCPALDQIGTINRNTAWGPRFFNSDISLSKAVTFREHYEAQFRMDAYNAFNHINLGNPGGNVENGGTIGGGPYPAGIGGTTNPRQIQFTVHLAF